MKIAYFDCFSGISGDMFTGALLDAGLNFRALKDELEKLNLPGYSVSRRKVTRGGISGTKFSVNVKDYKTPRNPDDILKIIKRSGLSEEIKEKSSEIFSSLARAEGKVHGVSPDKVHFHEVGAVDSIVDVVSALAGLKLTGIEKVFSSAVNTGSGFVNSSHGKLPVPAPAAVELLKGASVYSSGVPAELATPTGAALITSSASGFGEMPAMKVLETGYGAGSRDLSVPNLLRVMIGESEGERGDESVILVETNIDDMNPEFYGHVFELLFQSGALDVFMTPVFMKKQRPATKLSVLCAEEKLPAVKSVIFRETTANGLRYSKFFRETLERKTQKIKTGYGRIGVKLSFSGKEILSASPEYDDCVLAAKKHGAPLKDVYESAKKGALEWQKK